MATHNFNSVSLPYDPVIDKILTDARSDKAFSKSIKCMTGIVIAYRSTLHPSDQLLEAWYRFKENQPCPR